MSYFNNIAGFNYCYSSLSRNNTTANFGIDVTAGGSPGYDWGAWTNLLITPTSATEAYADSGDTITQVLNKDFYLMELIFHKGSTNPPIYCHLGEFGIDENGGTNFKPIIRDLFAGPGAEAPNVGCFSGMHYKFPIHIKSGSTIGVRVKGNSSGLGSRTLLAGVRLYGSPIKTEMLYVCSKFQTFGIVGTWGTQLPNMPSSSAYCADTLIGTTDRTYKYWNWGTCANTSGHTSGRLVFIFKFKPPGSNEKINFMYVRNYASSTEDYGFYNSGVFRTIPAGSELYCSGHVNSGSLNLNSVILIGGV